jgi:hypothetical protein
MARSYLPRLSAAAATPLPRISYGAPSL